MSESDGEGFNKYSHSISINTASTLLSSLRGMTIVQQHKR